MTKTIVTFVTYDRAGFRNMETSGTFKGLTKPEAQRLARCLRQEYDPVAAETGVGILVRFTTTESL